jgi:hypothetical protein
VMEVDIFSFLALYCITRPRTKFDFSKSTRSANNKTDIKSLIPNSSSPQMNSPEPSQPLMLPLPSFP